MRIRAATAGDAAAISALADQLGYAASTAEVRERLAAATVAVAEIDGQVAGWLQVEERRMIATGPIAEVSALVVDEKRRGSGAGVALLEWAEAWAGARDLPSVRIRCNEVRTETHEFYERRGYAVIKTQKVFSKEAGRAPRR